MDDVLKFFQNPMVMLIIAIAFFVIAIFYIFQKKKNNEEELEIEKIEETVNENLNRLFSVCGTKIKGYLTKDARPISEIDAYYDVTFERQNEIENKKILKMVKDLGFDYKLYIFKITDMNFISRFLKIFGIKPNSDFFIVPKKFILNFDGVSKTFTLCDKATFSVYAGVFVCDTLGFNFVNDISFRRAIEENMTYLQNYARKIVYMETKLPRGMERLQGIANNDVQKWKQYQARVMSDGKNTDDGEDDL